jgi:hypothetical protein
VRPTATCAGTMAALSRQGIELHEGLRLTLDTDDPNDVGEPDDVLVEDVTEYHPAGGHAAVKHRPCDAEGPAGGESRGRAGGP